MYKAQRVGTDKVQVKVPQDSIDVRAMKNASSPDTTHTMDAEHLMRTVHNMGEDLVDWSLVQLVEIVASG